MNTTPDQVISPVVTGALALARHIDASQVILRVEPVRETTKEVLQKQTERSEALEQVVCELRQQLVEAQMEKTKQERKRKTLERYMQNTPTPSAPPTTQSRKRTAPIDPSVRQLVVQKVENEVEKDNAKDKRRKQSL